MATLEIDFNCMCLFVPGQSGAMHVLLPQMGSHGAKHAVALVYKDVSQRPRRVPMKKWELLLRGTRPASTQSSRDASVRFRKLVPSLTNLTGRPVDRALLTARRPAGVVSRVSLRGSRIVAVDAQEMDVWELRRTEYVLAHRVVFRLDNLPDTLAWQSLGARGRVPLGSLRDIQPVDDGDGGTLHRLSVFHVLKKHLPPAPSDRLRDPEVRHHFARYYRLVGISRPGKELLPYRVTVASPPSGTHYCKTSRAAAG